MMEKRPLAPEEPVWYKVREVLLKKHDSGHVKKMVKKTIQEGQRQQGLCSRGERSGLSPSTTRTSRDL